MINLPAGRLNELLKLDNKKIFIIALVCSIVFYMDFSYLIKLQFKGIRTLTPKIIKLKKDLDNLTRDLPRLKDLERSKAGAEQKMAAPGLKKEIVQEGKILILLQEISDLANKHRVTITQINTARDKKIQQEVVAGEKLIPVFINLTLSCDYHSLGSFISALGNARYFTDVQDMKITRDARDYLLENASLILRTYVRE